jgi:nucleotide-binding universal stress UspA family protein
MITIASDPGSTDKPVAVGIDGSAADRPVLAWAAREAKLRRTELLIVHARDVVLASSAPETSVVSVLSESGPFGDELLTNAEILVRRIEPDVTVGLRLKQAKPADVLVNLSPDLSLLVLGTHGDNRFVGAVVGSVSQKVAAHAHCPVVVLPAGESRGTQASILPGSVVVGVSASTGGTSALRFAFAEAQLRGADVVAVRSWNKPGTYGIAAMGVGYAIAPPVVDWRPYEQAILDKCLAVVEREFPTVKVRPVLTESSADHALLEYAHEAELLVVGCRHDNNHRFSRLGPVGSWLLHNSPAPIAVVGFLLDERSTS